MEVTVLGLTLLETVVLALVGVEEVVSTAALALGAAAVAPPLPVLLPAAVVLEKKLRSVLLFFAVLCPLPELDDTAFVAAVWAVALRRLAKELAPRDSVPATDEARGLAVLARAVVCRCEAVTPVPLTELEAEGPPAS